MNAKLYKTEKENYVLVDPTKGTYDDGYMLGTSRGSQYNKLSIKNCQTIERGYDLDELLDNITPNNGTTGNISERIGFVKGFQKALELMGDKKFSEEDMRMAFFHVQNEPTFDEFIQSLQQTEWDVEIEMVKEHIGSGCYKKYRKLDDEGCLILKKYKNG